MELFSFQVFFSLFPSAPHRMYPEQTKCCCITCSAMYPSFVWNLPAITRVRNIFDIFQAFLYILEINEYGLLYMRNGNEMAEPKRVQNRFWAEICGICYQSNALLIFVYFVRVCFFFSSQRLTPDKIFSVYIYDMMCLCVHAWVYMFKRLLRKMWIWVVHPNFLIVWLCSASPTKTTKTKRDHSKHRHTETQYPNIPQLHAL